MGLVQCQSDLRSFVAFRELFDFIPDSASPTSLRSFVAFRELFDFLNMARTHKTKSSSKQSKLVNMANKMTKSMLKANIKARIQAISELSNNKYAAMDNADEIVAVGHEIEVLETAMRAKSTTLVDGDYHPHSFYSAPTASSFRTDCPSPTASEERGPTFAFPSTRL